MQIPCNHIPVDGASAVGNLNNFFEIIDPRRATSALEDALIRFLKGASNIFRSDGLLAASCEMSTQQSLEK
ncbi:hypothetical protein C2W62_09170 [Candidatus Entotheonella serta]|nr:hypothetical protein C2W62_09170 [Candidatus Entotheonella serta]